MIKELEVEVMPLTQLLIIVEASGSELAILVSAVIDIKAEVLGSVKKQLEVAVIRGQDDTKEILVSLKLLKLWNLVHMTFPREDVTSYML